MAETNSTIPEKTEKKSNLQKILGGIMVLLILLLGWQLFEQKSVSEKERGEKEEVKEELFELLDQYEQLNSNNEELNSELRTKESEIKDMIVNLEKLEKKSKEQAWLLNKYKKESKTLRSLLKGYLYEIDSLNKTIHVLEEEKTIVEDNFSKEQLKTANLTKEKNELTQKVAVGSKYKIYNLLTVGVRAKSGGREKVSSSQGRTTLFIITRSKSLPPSILIPSWANTLTEPERLWTNAKSKVPPPMS